MRNNSVIDLAECTESGKGDAMNETNRRSAGTNGQPEAGLLRELGAAELAGVDGGLGLLLLPNPYLQIQLQYQAHLAHNAFAFWGFSPTYGW
ncbi:MAG TPA: hypothetical protein VKA46_37025 [Gemmataceae bacterium]|nr:hypothetical protein [Gemmataceae bacterium]